MDNVIRVSISELLEVRADGLYAPELLSIIVGSCEYLQKLGKYGLFNVDYVFLKPNGGIEISLVSPLEVPEECVPPELRDNIEDDITLIRESQMVWCLGDIIKQACSPACTDAELFSLINFMTIHAVNGRPNITKVGQMSRNKCSSNGIEVNGVLKALYEEVMGDLDELLEEDLDSSAGWSGTNSLTQQQQHQEVAEHPVLVGISQAAHIPADMPDTPPSTSTSDNEEEIDSTNYHNRSFLPPVEEENNYKQATKIERKLSGDSTNTAQSSLSECTLNESRRESTSSDNTLPETGINKDDFIGLKDRDNNTPYQREEIISSPPLIRVKRDEEKTPTPPETTTPIPEIETQDENILTKTNYESFEEKLNIKQDKKDTNEMFPIIDYKKPKRFEETISEERTDEETKEEEDVPISNIQLPPSPKLAPKNASYTAISARKKSSRSGSIASSSDLPIPPSIAPRTATTETESNKRSSNPFDDENEDDNLGKLSRHNSLEPGRVRRSSRRNKGPSPYYLQQQQQQQGGKKTFSVPEFIDRPNMAIIRLQAQNSRKKKLTLHRIESTYVLVKLINGQIVEVNCKSDAIIQSIFDTVVEHFKLTEYSYFGLCIKRDDEYFFLDNNQKLEKYSPPGWKNAKKSNQIQYTLYLKFKSYPKKLEFIKTQLMIHSLYLQLRQDILSEVIKPTRDKIFELAALSLQAEFGDIPNPPKLGNYVPYFQLKNYLPNKIYINQESIKIEKMLSEIHSHYKGLSTIESEKYFIELCQKEKEYGVHYYKIYKIKPTTINNITINDINYIGILPDGIGLCNNNNKEIDILYQWNMIRTLQFDKKRFLISICDNNNALKEYIYYTKHYTISGYLVKFSATQHRFMMKMRQWHNTLQREKQFIYKDVDIEHNNEQENVNKPDFPLMPKKNDEIQPIRADIIEEGKDTNPFDEDNEVIHEEDEDKISDCIRIKIVLEKDPKYGLGLTLVDGTVDNIKGVYVKSVSPEGDANRKGLQRGDCIQSINDTSLVDKTRHDAVELVKSSNKFVELELIRFPHLNQIISHERQISKESNIIEQQKMKKPSISRTPPPVKKVTPTSHKQRAVSDFGAVGDNLPVLNSEELILSKTNLNKTTSDIDDDDDDNNDENNDEKYGEYKLPITSVYNFHVSDDDDDDDKADNKQSDDKNDNKNVDNNYQQHKRRISDNYQIDDTTSWISKSTFDSNIQKSSLLSHNNRHNLDWTHELSDIEDSRRNETNVQRIDVIIHRLGSKSLGFQVATSAGNCYVKAVSAEPAISADLRVDDHIISINDRPILGLTHQEIVDSLRTDRSPVIKLTVERMKPINDTEELITVTLEKINNESLGLSLAKRMGYEGIYIRNINPDSISDKDGRLRIGDRIWEINGENVSNENTNLIVEKLKNIDGRLVEIVVKRIIE